MGNFSRDPQARTADAVGKRYVAVRLQQAVPILDADWNLLDDLRRRDAELLGGRFLGDGVPTGSDGFRIFSNGQPNDFGIKAGLLIVGGKVVQIDADSSYVSQPSFNNPAVTPTVGPLTAPATNTAFVAYLDTWEREVDSLADGAMLDTRIGIETAIRLQRAWSVRAAPLTNFAAIAAAAPAGHLFYPLAQLNRLGGNDAITDNMIADSRDTDASPRREVAYRRGVSGQVLVDTAAFLATMSNVRDDVNDFLVYLTTKFVDPASPYVAAEVMGFETLRAIASVADSGVALANGKALDTRGALKIYAQLLDAEKRFLNVWQNFVLPLVKPTGTIYKNAFLGMVQSVADFVNGPAPTGFVTLADALQAGNLLEAQRLEDQVNNLFTGELTRPLGFLDLTYLGSPSGNITLTVPFDLRFRLSGNITPDDAINVQVFADTEWKSALRNSDGSTPFALHFGPGADSKEFLVTVTPSNVAPAQTTLSVAVSAQHNPGGVQHVSGQLALKVGSLPPPTGVSFNFSVPTTTLPQVAGVYQIGAGGFGNIKFRLTNNTNTAAQLAITFTPTVQTGWKIVPPTGIDLANQQVAAQSQVDYLFQFQAPGTPGQQLVLQLAAKDAASTTVAKIQVTLVSV